MNSVLSSCSSSYTSRLLYKTTTTKHTNTINQQNTETPSTIYILLSYIYIYIYKHIIYTALNNKNKKPTSSREKHYNLRFDWEKDQQPISKYVLCFQFAPFPSVYFIDYISIHFISIVPRVKFWAGRIIAVRLNWLNWMTFTHTHTHSLKKHKTPINLCVASKRIMTNKTHTQHTNKHWT